MIQNYAIGALVWTLIKVNITRIGIFLWMFGDHTILLKPIVICNDFVVYPILLGGKPVDNFASS